MVVNWPSTDVLGVTQPWGNPDAQYRPDLEKHCGRQGWDWDWAIKEGPLEGSAIYIKLRKKREACSSLLQLKWINK